MERAVLDHVAIGTRDLTAGWQLFGSLLGGTWAYGGDSRGYWWGQLEFASGPKIELLTPTGGPDAAFLERFLASRGAGPHHFNFITADIEDRLARLDTARQLASRIIAQAPHVIGSRRPGVPQFAPGLIERRLTQSQGLLTQ